MSDANEDMASAIGGFIDNLKRELAEANADRLRLRTSLEKCKADRRESDKVFLHCQFALSSPPPPVVSKAEHERTVAQLDAEIDAERTITRETLTKLHALEKQRDELLDVLRDIYHDADMWADGSSDACQHDKFCNELVGKIKPLIQP